MKRSILMAGAAMLIAVAAIAGNNTKVQSCCKGSKCEKACAKNCACGAHCSPDNCKSNNCTCSK